MSKRILFFGFLIAVSAFAHAAPGVWEQLQHGSVFSVRGIVKSIDIDGSEIHFRVETKDSFGDLEVRSDRLCKTSDGVEDNRESEEVRAALLKSKIDMLQDARRSGKPIEYSTKGPWKPCVSVLRSLES